MPKIYVKNSLKKNKNIGKYILAAFETKTFTTTVTLIKFRLT